MGTLGLPASLDGLLVIDKPTGPTSHDVVARLRRALREKRIGHTGTLDPMATGVLALVVGRATRLAQFLGADEKTYDARIRLGQRTDTYDAEGTPVGRAVAGPWPSVAEVEAALTHFRGTFLQQPPAYSAKKIAGQRWSALARARSRKGHDQPAGESEAPGPADLPTPASLPPPVPVTVHTCDITACADGFVSLSLTVSAGFYVRSLANDLGERLGIGAHLAALRRTRSGAVSLAEALSLAAIEADAARAIEALVPMARMLPHLPAVTLTPAGVTRTQHGATLGPGDLADGRAAVAAGLPASTAAVRLLAPDGTLVAIGRPAGPATTALHPSVVLM